MQAKDGVFGIVRNHCGMSSTSLPVCVCVPVSHLVLGSDKLLVVIGKAEEQLMCGVKSNRTVHQTLAKPQNKGQSLTFGVQDVINIDKSSSISFLTSQPSCAVSQPEHKQTEAKQFSHLFYYTVNF